MVMHLKPECVDAYVEYHRNVWPELEDAYHRAGVKDITCYLHDTTLIVTMEVDPEVYRGTDIARGRHPVEQRWQAEMAKLRADDLTTVAFEEVYRLPPA